MQRRNGDKNSKEENLTKDDDEISIKIDCNEPMAKWQRWGGSAGKEMARNWPSGTKQLWIDGDKQGDEKATPKLRSGSGDKKSTKK